jgi:hypothetical protein
VLGPETCITCHSASSDVAASGSGHQAYYNQLYQDGVVKVSGMALTSNGVDTTTLTFKMTKNGAGFDCTKSTASTSDFTIGSYWAKYDAATKDGEVTMVVANRFMVTIEGSGAEQQDLVAYAGAIDFKALQGL